MFFLDPISSFLCPSDNRRGARRALLHNQPLVLRYLRLLLGGDSIAILVMSPGENPGPNVLYRACFVASGEERREIEAPTIVSRTNTEVLMISNAPKPLAL